MLLSVSLAPHTSALEEGTFIQRERERELGEGEGTHHFKLFLNLIVIWRRNIIIIIFSCRLVYKGPVTCIVHTSKLTPASPPPHHQTRKPQGIRTANFLYVLWFIPSTDARMRGVVSSTSVSESLSEHVCGEYINFHQQFQI